MESKTKWKKEIPFITVPILTFIKILCIRTIKSYCINEFMEIISALMILIQGRLSYNPVRDGLSLSHSLKCLVSLFVLLSYTCHILCTMSMIQRNGISITCLADLVWLVFPEARLDLR